MRGIAVLLLVAVSCCASLSAQELIGAQPTITATGARALVDACLAYAKANKQRVGIAVVDPHGNLLDYHAMEGTNVIAGESAILKAKTAVRWWRSTEELNARVLKEENVAPVWIGDFPQRGGVPIFVKGEIVGGMGEPEEPPEVELRSSLRFLGRMARALVHRMPELSAIKVVRQWAGCYDLTPDHNPIVGEVDTVSGFFQLHGFSGHGFMMAPAVCRIVGEHIAKGTADQFVSDNSLGRFKSGQAREPETLIIG